ncbi:GNAT family N-acetyltransferase [Altererythrobacter sp.]|uniref:GNAT family N-acetyltransferase n=1 Tax=Altererythrobacter sp. TaxID=1872480 RepID=UPI003CFBEB17
MTLKNWTVRPFRPSDGPAFAALNRRWIEELFALEEKDRQQLEEPQTTILDKGGFIAMADLDGWVIGTGAILPATHAPDDGNRWMEVVKMTTDLAAQRSGVGTAILQQLIDFARERDANAVWLETNSTLAAATALYEKFGFRQLDDSELWQTPYDRCNLQMVLHL